MTNSLDRAIAHFRKSFGGEPAFVARAPGRVNLLGEHVDYNDGWVLPVAIDRAAYVAVRRRADERVCLRAVDLQAEVQFRLRDLDSHKDEAGRALPAWAAYPAGVAWALRERGLGLTGIEATLSSDVPVGAGLSSSAAVEVAFATAWQHLGAWPLSRMELAQACQRAENQYVGVSCGLMDQFASAHGQAGHALLLDCRTLDWQALPLPPSVAVVVADTRVRRSLGDSAYNERTAQCREAVRLLQAVLPGIRALRDVTPADFDRHAERLPEPVRSRARHVVEECARTVAAAADLRAGRVEAFGQHMIAGHRSLRDLYAVSIPELDVMAETAWGLPGCYGARLTGAGFGGCTVGLVQADATESFRQALASGYQSTTGIAPEIYVCTAAEGAGVIAGG